jgi:NAD(P)-dependent dehydrogenase (short-subunit alcohol dehydrogenase family)
LQSVINNAGMVQVKSLDECSEQDWDFVMAVNVKSMFLAAKYAMPHLRKNRRSHIGIEYVWIDWEHCNEVDNVSETILFRDFLRQRTARWFRQKTAT